MCPCFEHSGICGCLILTYSFNSYTVSIPFSSADENVDDRRKRHEQRTHHGEPQGVRRRAHPRRRRNRPHPGVGPDPPDPAQRDRCPRDADHRGHPDHPRRQVQPPPLVAGWSLGGSLREDQEQPPQLRAGANSHLRLHHRPGLTPNNPAFN